MSTALIAIVGRPNVGKSSLFNRLVGLRQAITHETAGTTRDANYAGVSWRDRHFTMVDTAGLSRAEGEIELAAQDQIRSVATSAAVIIVVVDAANMITTEDEAAARLALKTGKPVILALGKADTARDIDENSFRRLGIPTIVPVSAIHGRGTGDLLDEITKLIPATPPENAEAPIKLALIGRPNVGKSSILNTLIGKQSAIVSNIAGTTRDTTSQQLKYHGQTIELVDTAGLRRRGKIEPGIEKYGSMRTLAAINEADICALVLDAADGIVATDMNLAGQILEAGKGLIIVMNKWDAVEDKDDKTQSRMTAKVQNSFQFASWAPLLYTSATTGLHITQLLELVTEIAERRHQTITTGPLNRLVEKMVQRQPPAGLKNRQPKIQYATQTGTNPPAFTFFTSYAELVHFSYKRYLENGLRAEYDFVGTPISLNFRSKSTGPRPGGKGTGR
ncbi:ribosome biogenesis GTPase Der [Candidatus Saccharibacteria bacterium]|nr:ribosome biogenesis GTPase Der [Candidatus Saccharibacteria bacterium]